MVLIVHQFLVIAHLFFSIFFYLNILTKKDNSHIMITSLCNVYPLTPNFYIVKLGFTGYTFFRIFAKKHRLRVLIRTASVRRF